MRTCAHLGVVSVDRPDGAAAIELRWLRRAHPARLHWGQRQEFVEVTVSRFVTYVQHLAKVELLSVLRVAKQERERDWLMFLVAYWHGLRATEVVKLKRDAIANGHITVHRLKGSETTTQPLIANEEPLLNERAALETLAQSTPKASPIFPFSRVHYFRLFRKYAKRAGLPAHKWHPHSLKHSIAMHTIKGAGIENVRKYLGHKSMASTGEYLKVTDEEASAAIAGAMSIQTDGEKN